MLSKLKKSDAPPPVAPSWHPDFRHKESLPDIKRVRTTFWINGPAIFVVLALAMYFGIQQWQLRSLKQQLAETEARVARDKKPSDLGKALFTKFQAEEARIVEVSTFVNSKPVFSSMILRLAQTLPPNCAIDGLDLTDYGLTMRLSLRGDPAVASGYATAYLEQLRADKELAIFDEFAFASAPTRNQAGRVSVEFRLHLKGGRR